MSELSYCSATGRLRENQMISAHEYKVLDILGDKFIHEIPPYQRPYAWKKEQVLELLDDLLKAAEAQNKEPVASY